MMELYKKLEKDEWGLVVVVRLDDVHYWSKLQVHNMMMTELVEQWNNDTLSFNLPKGEATITLLDVWRI